MLKLKVHRVSDDIEERLYKWASQNMKVSVLAGKTFSEVLEELLIKVGA